MSTLSNPPESPGPEAPGSSEARIGIVAAVAAELAPLVRRLRDADEVRIGRRPAMEGAIDDQRVVLMACGMGKTNAAQALTALIERGGIRSVLNTGIAGAYPDGGLGVGEVAVAASESYGDEGVVAPSGWGGTDVIGIPLVVSDAGTWYNDLPMDARLVAAAADALEANGRQVRVGPFVTVSACSGTARGGAALAGRFAAICETMEGAAFAHVALHYAVPFLEVRGISNLVEDRDLSRWQLDRAIEAACEAAAAVLPAFPAGASRIRPGAPDDSPASAESRHSGAG